MATAQDIVTDALLEISVLTAPGQTPSASHSAFVLGRLNQLISEWNVRAQFLYCVDRFEFPLLTSQTEYTIGPSGADFIAPRPNGEGPGKGILNANIVTPGSPDVFFPINIIPYAQWATMPIRSLSTGISRRLYNDGAYPNSTIHLYGQPTGSYSLEIWVRHQASEFASLATTFDMPPGYQKAIMLTLAENIFGAFSKIPGSELTEVTMNNARIARGAIANQNSSPNRMSNDAAGLRPSSRAVSAYNYRTGGY